MTNDKKRLIFNIKGIVQGVGFRPFVYNLAVQSGIFGWVMNYSGGVLIEAEGEKNAVDSFAQSLIKEAPPLALINICDIKEAEPLGYSIFEIKGSTGGSGCDTFISPDVAVCSECIGEMFNPDNHRYLYPFINCTNCGPRFTITKAIPYDRCNTTMESFEMCESCAKEYENPSDRRFHAQPTACPECGPELVLLDQNGKRLYNGCEAVKARELLKKGRILAIKGLGGYHLACNARDADAVKLLRKRKLRDGKPFALMARDIDAVSNFCTADEKELELLKSYKRPIVLLKRKQECDILSENISSDNNMLGMMLPYTPLHYLLFDEDLDILVMTSGNRSGEPIFYKDEEALEGLKGIADYFLTNNREIYIRTDDSVTSVFRGKEYIIRRSRGYVPLPVDISAAVSRVKSDKDLENIRILSCGGELKNTFCLTKGDKAFLSHHIGDLESMETLESFKDGIEHFKKIFSSSPELIAYDSHPEYMSTKYALDISSVATILVQHHHAHIASCMIENQVTEPVIGVAFDGTGYGDDGCIWGGEFFTCDYSGFIREAHLSYVPMPGGEKCIQEPWRMAAGYLYKSGELDGALRQGILTDIEPLKLDIVRQQLQRNINAPLTSSMGRLFDAVSSIIGVCHTITYEGEAAIKLEKLADIKGMDSYPYTLEYDGAQAVINTGDLIHAVIADVSNGRGASAISGIFHNTVSRIVLDVCNIIREKSGINSAVLSGGVFQNRVLLELTVMILEKEGFKVYTHSVIPANDGGIALGQAAIALRRYMESLREEN